MNKKKKLQLFIVLSVLIVLFVNITLISGYFLMKQYGSMTLNPGERYTINIPFFGTPKTPLVCGTAEQTDGTPMPNVTVIINYSNGSPAGQAITDTNGKYCITLPEITSPKVFDVYVEYNNGTSSSNNLTLASNDYDLNLDTNLENYIKGTDTSVKLIGNIINEDAGIDDGRLEIKVSYHNQTNISHQFWEDVSGYERYTININPRETYNLPTSELDYSWTIPSNAIVGEYKFYIKTSFNAQDHTSTLYFNIN
jgi:hypothetical protein